MQHVQAGAIAVIDLETEFFRAADHVDVVVDDGHVHVARKQRLAHHLAEAAEANDQHAAAQVIRFLHPVHRRLYLGRETLKHDHEQRRQHHRQNHDGSEVGVDCGIDDLRAGRRGKQHESEFTALRHQHRTVQCLSMVAAYHARHHVDAQRLDRHHGQYRRHDQRPVLHHHGHIQRHTHAEEEQAQQDAAEGFNIRLDLVPER